MLRTLLTDGGVLSTIRIAPVAVSVVHSAARRNGVAPITITVVPLIFYIHWAATIAICPQTSLALDLSSGGLLALGSCAHLRGGSLAHFRRCGLLGSSAHLSGAHLSGAHLSGLVLSGGGLLGSCAHLSGAHLSGTHLSGAHLSGLVLSGGGLLGSCAHLSGSLAHFRRCSLLGSGAHLGRCLALLLRGGSDLWLDALWFAQSLLWAALV